MLSWYLHVSRHHDSASFGISALLMRLSYSIFCISLLITALFDYLSRKANLYGFRSIADYQWRRARERGRLSFPQMFTRSGGSFVLCFLCVCSFYHFFVCFPCSSLEILSPMHKNGNRALQTNDDSSSLFLQALHIWSMKNDHNRFCILDDRNCLMNKMSSWKHLNFVFSSVSLRFEDKIETSFQTPQKTIINWINRNVCICYSRQHN